MGRMRRSWPALRGRRDSSRPGPADPAGALAAVIAERQQHTSIRALAVRAARADRRAAALAAAAALTCPVRTAAELRRLAMEPDQLAGEQCLNAERPVHEYPPVSGGLPASRPRCVTGAHCDIRSALEPPFSSVRSRCAERHLLSGCCLLANLASARRSSAARNSSGAIVKTCGWEPHRPSGDRRPRRRCCRTRW
jgi:hypothetical protein